MNSDCKTDLMKISLIWQFYDFRKSKIFKTRPNDVKFSRIESDKIRFSRIRMKKPRSLTATGFYKS